MAELIATGYKRLFEVRILHHYWLDDGTTIYDNLTETERIKKILNYKIDSLISINPTPLTRKTLKGIGGIAKQTGLGLVVALPADKVIPDDTVFGFTIEIKESSFYKYTALTLQNHKISDCFSPGENRIVRYKENTPVFSNLTGVSRGSGAGKQLFLSKEIPALTANDQVEALVISGNALLQLTGSQPGAATQQLSSNAASMPVFYHQQDAPQINPPPGLLGAPARGIELTQEFTDNVFGIVEITAVKAGDADYSCTSGGIAKENYPIFQIRFKNRSVIWKYLRKSNGSPVSESPAPLPLTYSGNAGTKQKPSAGFIKADFESNNPANKIERIYTEIFE